MFACVSADWLMLSLKNFAQALVFCIGKMVQLEGEQLNSLIHALEEWERHLAQLDSKSLRCVDVKLIP